MERAGGLLAMIRGTRGRSWCKRGAGQAGRKGETGEGGRRGEVAEADVIIEVFFRWARGCRRGQLRGNVIWEVSGSVIFFLIFVEVLVGQIRACGGG